MTSLLEQQKVSRIKISRENGGHFFDKYCSISMIFLCVIVAVLILATVVLPYYSSNKIEKFANNSASADSSIGSSTNIANMNIGDKKVADELAKINKEITPVLNNYKHLDVSIVINNTGKTCGNWSNYMDGIYSKYGSKCVNIDDTQPNEYYCVNTDDNNIISCNNYMSPSVLENIEIDTAAIISKNNTQFLDAIANYIDVCNNFEAELSGLINTIKSAGSIANNQSYFYENNQNNLDAKQNLNKSFKQIYEDDTDAINIKKDNILHQQDLTNELVKSNESVYNIVKYMVLIFIILAVANIVLTRV